MTEHFTKSCKQERKMELHDHKKRGSPKTKDVKRKSTIAFPVKIWLGQQETSQGTIECSTKGSGGAAHAVLSSRKTLAKGGTYSLVCRTKKSHREWDVVVKEVIKENHIDSKYNVEIVKIHKYNF